MIQERILELVEYGLVTGLMTEEDKIFTTNALLELFQVDDIEDSVLSHINITSKKIANLLMEKLNCQGLTLVENNGIVQEVKHYHLHLIPKYNNETKLTLEEVYNKIIN